MKKYFITEIIIAGILLLLLLLFLNPTELLMPQTIEMLLILGIILVFLAFSIFIWKEQAKDEREHLHQLSASRTAFLIGSAVLIAGITIQSLKHNIDPWLIYTQITMVLAKISSRIYNEYQQ